ncbi:MAG: glycoside hydrolase family 2 protein [Lachnospiraceae bacterium]|nr:glycoside hydrolase family 2 protein [Lachnospiraceae bacterium]
MADGSVNADDLKEVRLPHTVCNTPLHYFDEQEYQMVSGYMRKLSVSSEWEGKVLLLTLEGAAHISTVYVNGKPAGEHRCGYTAFTLDISSLVDYGKDNILAVKVDSREDVNVPPFGFVIDYMTYGGIYRDVYLDVKEPSRILDVFVSTKQADRFGNKDGIQCCKKSTAISDIEISHPMPGMVLRQSVSDGKDFRFIGEVKLDDMEKENEVCRIHTDFATGEIKLWDVDSPSLYMLKTELVGPEGVKDESIVRYGYRKAVFKKNGFYLNGRKLKIRGLNRHQSFPYVGYAMPKSVQEHDADILKNELGLNAVRTSHYPQSHYFIDRCDEIGLLVFTELPGWQHIGDEAWKDQAVENVRDMILQYRNHASIILWGVRINESVDDDEFYKRTNDLARSLDPTRPTGGVRCYKKGSFLEDVFTYNDFVHSGKNRGCEKKAAVTSDKERPYLVSEYMGHMFPTKAFDCEEHRSEHAYRHAKVLNDVNGQDDIAGSFGWCMTDYNTHRDFGSGDRICYHGVMDMFRNPKMAAFVYASQQDERPVLEISSSMDIGEHPGCNRGRTFIFTNADSVRMYRNDIFIREFTDTGKLFPHLKHAPIEIDDYIGDRLAQEENMPPARAEEVKAVLNEAAKAGLYNMSKRTWLKAGKMMLFYDMKPDDAVQLYNKYIGDWGGKSTQYRFEAVKDGKVVKTLIKGPVTRINLEMEADRCTLAEEHSYDVACIRIRAVDASGNVLPYFNDPVMLETEGCIELVGPSVTALSGGMGGAYVRTVGKKGKGTLKARTVEGLKVSLDFDVKFGIKEAAR